MEEHQAHAFDGHFRPVLIQTPLSEYPLSPPSGAGGSWALIAAPVAPARIGDIPTPNPNTQDQTAGTVEVFVGHKCSSGQDHAGTAVLRAGPTWIAANLD